MPTIVSLRLRSGADLYEDVDLDALTPRARALAEAVAQTALRSAVDIWMESNTPIRDTSPNWRLWHTEEEAALPERRPWRGWARYPVDSQVTPVQYLETEARKIPPDWHVLGARTDSPVPSLAAGTEDAGMTRDMVLKYLRTHGRDIGPSTWSSYVARKQAPGPARHVGRTPIWDRADIDAFLAKSA